jgi:hypothetical protein
MRFVEYAICNNEEDRNTEVIALSSEIRISFQNSNCLEWHTCRDFEND